MSFSSSTTATSSPRRQEVSLVVTSAPLLSGDLRDCADPVERAVRCATGGVATVQALVRYHNNEWFTSTATNYTFPVLVVPMGDFKSTLVEMSRFAFGVNVMIYANELKWRIWTVPAYTLKPRRFEYSAVYDAQDPLMPAVVSNVVTAPNETWHPYVKSLHFDEETHLALIYITKEYLETTTSQVESVQLLLHYIQKYNQANRCQIYDLHNDAEGEVNVEASSHSIFQDIPFSQWWKEQGPMVLDAMRASNNRDPQNQTSSTSTWPKGTSLPSQLHNPDNCFVPVVVFDDESKEQFDIFVQAFNQTVRNNTYPATPNLIVDIRGHALSDENQSETHLITVLESSSFDLNTDDPATWLVSYKSSPETYDQLKILISSDGRRIEGVDVVHGNLLEIPEEAKTEEFYEDLENIGQYANEALETSLIKEIGVKTLAMPQQTNPVDGFRYCYVGECEMGNLYADALRWIEDADIGLLPSFMFNGPGWREGEIRTLEILENLPYATSRCAGTMTGHSLLRILNHSLRATSFGGYDSETVGGMLLQVSGLRVVYNLMLEGNRVVSVEVFDRNEGAFLPLQMTRLYTFASCAHLCFTFTEFPPLFGEFLDNKGEVPAIQSSDSDIKEDLKQYLVSTFSSSTYLPRREGRLVNNETRITALPFVEKEDCVQGKTYWSSEIFDCQPCPGFENLQFSRDEIHLEGRAYDDRHLDGKVEITNMETFPIEVTTDTLVLPEYVAVSLYLADSIYLNNTLPSFILHPDDVASLEIIFDPSKRVAGTDTSSIVFTVSSVPQSPSCPINKVIFDIEATLSLSPDDNQLGALAAFGYAAAALIVVASVTFASWVGMRRKSRIVSTMQPVFLIPLCVGVLLMGSALIPFSIDDKVASYSGCDVACVARPWLLSVGSAFCIAALFAKLYRINKLFHSQSFRRMQVQPKDVMILPIAFILVIVALNIVWNVLDPPHWERRVVQGQPYTSYGTCTLGETAVGTAMFASIVVICGTGFVMTAWQAFLARNISSEFSESKYLGIAVFSWLQLGLVGVPVLLLIDSSNVSARYSLWVGIIFILCMSMLLVVFVPIMRVKFNANKRKSHSKQYSLYKGLQIHFARPNSKQIGESTELEKMVLASVNPLANRTKAEDLVTTNDNPLKRELSASEPTRLRPSSLNLDNPTSSLSMKNSNSSGDLVNGNCEFSNDEHLDKSDGDACDQEKYDPFTEGIIEEA
jgi:hypothetical protein